MEFSLIMHPSQKFRYVLFPRARICQLVLHMFGVEQVLNLLILTIFKV